MSNPSRIDGIDPTAPCYHFEYEDIRTDRQPEVGIGGTITVGSDRYPVTICLLKGKTQCIVVEDHWKVTEGSWRDGGVKLSFTPSDPVDALESGNFADVGITKPGPRLRLYTRRKDGRWRERGGNYSTLTVGVRDAYQDPHF